MVNAFSDSDSDGSRWRYILTLCLLPQVMPQISPGGVRRVAIDGSTIVRYHGCP